MVAGEGEGRGRTVFFVSGGSEINHINEISRFPARPSRATHTERPRARAPSHTRTLTPPPPRAQPAMEAPTFDHALLVSVASGLGRWTEGAGGGAPVYVKDEDCVGEWGWN